MNDVRNQNSSTSSASAQSTTPAASAIANAAKDQVSAFASDAMDKAKDIGSQASSSTANLKDRASDLIDSAKDMATDSSGKILGALEEQKAAGADKVSGFAEAMRRAADELDKELPPAANLVRQAAEQIDVASDAIRNRDFGQLAGTVQDFARRQPAAFLGMAVLAGFAVVRLMKVPVSSATQSAHTGTSGGMTGSPNTNHSSNTNHSPNTSSSPNTNYSSNANRSAGTSGEFNRS